MSQYQVTLIDTASVHIVKGISQHIHIDNVSDILKSVSLDEGLKFEEYIDLHARFLLGSYSKEGGGGDKSPARSP